MALNWIENVSQSLLMLNEVTHRRVTMDLICRFMSTAYAIDIYGGLAASR